jgi:hypothetical protein
MGVEGSIERAEELFKSADLAAGVAATDALSGDPGRNLAWHLERASEHSRATGKRQRARPPLTPRRRGSTRAADRRPSRRDRRVQRARREGALRRDGLAAKTLDLSRPRPTDPQLAHYVAATDLLAAHRSFEAAQALLHSSSRCARRAPPARR